MTGPETMVGAALRDWPVFGWADDIRPALAEMVDRQVPGVLATLYKVVGGSPRPAGSQMLIVEGRLHGYLSGGCIEGDVFAHAHQVLQTGRPQRLVYGDGGPFADIRLVCGGRVEILLEALSPAEAPVADLLRARADRKTALWASDGLERLCRRDAVGLADQRRGLAAAGLAALAAQPDALCVSVSDGRAVALRYQPTRRLVVVGHDPTALAIARLASLSGFETHLLRPKGPASPPPLPGVAYHREEVVEALATLGLDPWTSVAIATHALEEDEAALLTALPSRAAYVGVLGAQRRLPERFARLRAAGLAPEVVARLHAPIGLDLGGKAPFEIAVAVMAEVMAEANLRRPKVALDCEPSGAKAA